MNDTEIVALAQTGSGEAFRALFARYRGVVLKRCLLLAKGDHELAEDIMQSTFLRVHRCIKDFRGDSDFVSWLYQVATRAAIRELRRRQSALQISNDDEESSWEEIVSRLGAQDKVDLERKAYLQTALALGMARLAEEEAGLIRRHFIEGMTFDEIAEADNTSKDAVYRATISALKHLRKVMGVEE